MKNVKQISKLRTVIMGFLPVLAAALFFSCSKNAAELPLPGINDAAVANASPGLSNRNSNVAVPFETTLFVPCANNGAGEDVVLTGSINFVQQLSWTDHGFTLVYHDNVKGLKGAGLSSGETFVASGGTNGTVMGSWVNSQWTGTTIRQLRVIGQDSHFFMNYKYHITVTSDGNVKVNSAEQTADCK